eukprot:TRINITY_DN16542_c0_g1_i1.p1 TRINITY_DN16542_c0_g1~~TRINITY_DN16542_c0_g1_i1.p1  ORF type:complete len:597 (-),score=74.92 TRINITY_DN16542_c0_g1_i1:72-1862(-)
MAVEADNFYDVVVVGFGPVGCACANLLCKRGFRVLIVEQTDARFTRPRAIAMRDDGMRLLQEIGILDAFLVDTSVIRGSMLVDANGCYLNGSLTAEQVGKPGSWGLPPEPDNGSCGLPPSVFFYQPRLEQLLRDNLRRWGRKCHVSLQTKFLGFTESSEGVISQLCESRAEWQRQSGGEMVVVHPDPVSDGRYSGQQDQVGVRTVRSRYLLGCDGARSSVNSVGLNPSGSAQLVDDLRYDEQWCVIDVELYDESAVGQQLPDVVTQYCVKERPHTYMTGSRVTDGPRRGRHIRWEFQVMPGDDKELVVTHAWIRDNFISKWLRPEQYDIIRSAVYRFHSLVAQRWRSTEHGRTFILGDAAHQTPPFNGEGLLGGFRDARNLCWKLAMALHLPCVHDSPLLDTYQIERFEAMLEGIQQSMETGKLVQTFAEGYDEELIATHRNQGYARGPHTGKLEVPALPAGSFVATGRKVPEDKFTGTFCPQPRIGNRPLDEIVGHGFALLVNADSVARISAEVTKALASVQGIVFPFSVDAMLQQDKAERQFAQLLKENMVVLLRPDKIIYGVVPKSQPLTDIGDLVRQLIVHLGFTSPGMLKF